MLKGEVNLIGDKSISHRAIMFSAISKGRCKITNFLMGEDCLSTISCFRKLGVNIEVNKEEVYVDGVGLRGLKSPTDILDVGNSGTTARLIMGILAGSNIEATIIGDESISKRPMKRVIDPLKKMNCNIKGKDNNFTPINIIGGNIKGINYKMEVSSAQVKSALILASLYANEKTTIIEKEKSRNHTELMLKDFGANIKVDGLNIEINPVDELYNKDIDVPGDISSAAFIIVATLISKGSEVLIKNVGINPTRTGILDVLFNMNANINILNKKNISGELVGDILVKYTPNLKSTVIDKDIIPRLIDEIPIISVLATQADGETIIKDASELKVKESNRITSIVENLKNMGAEIQELEDGLIIKGRSSLKGCRIKTYNDHRIAMAFDVASIVSDSKVILDNEECVDISFPGYFELMNKLRK